MDPRQEVVFQSARAGDPRAFRSLIDHLGPPLVRFVTYLLRGDGDAAHDVVQDVFVRAWQALPTVESADHLRNWCYRVARCKSASMARRQGSRRRLLEHLATLGDAVEVARSEGAHAPAPPEAGPPYEELRAAMHRLPRVYLAPIQLHYLQGLDTVATAQLLGLTVTTTKMRLRRGRQHLKRFLTRREGFARHGPRAAARPGLGRESSP